MTKKKPLHSRISTGATKHDQVRDAALDAMRRSLGTANVFRVDDVIRLDKGWLVILFVETPTPHETFKMQRVVRLRDDLTYDWSMIAD